MEKSLNNQSLASARDRHSANLDDIFKVVTFIKDNTVTKKEFNAEISGIKYDAYELRGALEDLLSSVNEFAEKTERHFDCMDGEIKEIKGTMVTKDYLDEKMTDSRGDSVVMMTPN